MNTSGNNTPRTRDVACEFKKGVKRDPSSFHVFKDEKQWDCFHRSLKAQADTQDVTQSVSQALAASYAPSTAKNNHMHTVFK
jgi:hypothetical protein